MLVLCVLRVMRIGRTYGNPVIDQGGPLALTPTHRSLTLNTLVDGESSRARRWGAALAATAGLAVPAA
jgi:hypothetical protein